MKVTDYDSLNSHDLVEKVFVQMTGLTVASSFTSATSYSGQHGQGSITLQFQVVCDTNYYGANCVTFCQPTNSSAGHYTCASDGSKVCLSGWSNPSGNCLTRESFMQQMTCSQVCVEIAMKLQQ